MTARTLHKSEPLRARDAGRGQLPPWQKVLLILGLLWALTVIVPDFYRLYGQLAQFPFSADNSGLIYHVEVSDANGAGPAGNSDPGVRENDRIGLQPGPCWSPSSGRCRDFLAVFGGMGGLTYVRDGTTVTLPVIRNSERPAEVTISAGPKSLEPVAKFMLALDEIAGVIVLWLAFKLVWDLPGRMTLGFFLFTMWFNPGQYFTFYAWLQGYPILLLTQEGLQALAQGAGYAGFLIFALRFPHDRTERRLQGIERMAIVAGVALALLQLASFANVFGVATEIITRWAILGGYMVALCAFAIVWYRLKYQSPLDYQRMRWVLWGCAIGLPAFIFADSNEATSLWSRYVWNRSIWRGWSRGESIFEFCFLVSGILFIFICAAVRHRRILNVSLEVRALAVMGLVLILGVKIEDWMHGPMTTMFNSVGIPPAIQDYASIVPLVFCSVAAHQSAHTAHRFLNRSFYHASMQLKALGNKAEKAASIEALDSILVHGPYSAFRLASAAAFREASHLFRLVLHSKGWDSGNPSALESPAHKRLLEDLKRGAAVRLPLPPQSDDAVSAEVRAPALAVPVIFTDKVYAVAMYGPHETGAGLDRLEVDALEGFARDVAVGYERVIRTSLEREVQALRKHD